MGEMCQAFGAFSRKTARLRDKGMNLLCQIKVKINFFIALGDEICQKIKDYSEIEIINQSTQQALSVFTKNFSAVQDFRDLEVT